MANHDVMLYALSTCIHCRHLKQMLNENKVDYNFRDVDTATGDDRQQLIDQVKKLNPNLSFPTLVVDGKVFVGFREQPIKEALDLQ